MKSSYLEALLAAALLAEPENQNEYKLQLKISKLVKEYRGLIFAANSYIDYFGDFGEDVASIYKEIKRI